MDYCFNMYMFFVQKCWGGSGFFNWDVMVGEKGEDFYVMVILIWDKVEFFVNVFYVVEVMGDVFNFINMILVK